MPVLNIIISTDRRQQAPFLPVILLLKRNTMNKVNISHVSNMHNQWLRSLNFYKTETAILKGLLTEIAGKNTGSDTLKEVEHFENQFYIQSNAIDTLAHDIHQNIGMIAKQVKDGNAGYIDASLLTTHEELGKKTENQENIMTDLVRSFRKFAEKWM